MLTVNSLYKKYKNTVAVDNVSFTINPGEITMLLGPNGAGKSTTIKSISGLISYQGNISINGYPNRSIDAKRLFAYVPEIPHNFDYLTVIEHCDFIAKAYKIEDPLPVINEYLELFEMDDKKDKLGRELSKGMQQKLSIICAMIINPQVIMLDEPLIGLDPKAIRECKNLMVKLRDNGASILVSTHIIDTLSDIWDRVLIMNRGRLVFETTRLDFEKEHPGMTLEEMFFSITEDK
ncbi:MAG: ABC transporter ATP-binding protein [Clostridiales bacterium]|jgi:ABC-type multidrug transport system ATPase subunit|nr:ABC transporter ATP-binding protein [Clostridiales bacterium]